MKATLFRHQKTFSQVMYATRNGRRTVLHMDGGEKIETFVPMKKLLQEAPSGLFSSVNKGIVVAKRYVASVEDNVFTMTDGTRFKGRVRKKARETLPMQEDPDAIRSEWEKFAVVDDLPLAFCVIELVFDEHGRGLDFIFRYCNREMETLEGKRIDEMLNRSFYEVFENGDKKWLVVYADVALNGVKRTIESYSPEINANLRIYCYQPRPNYCACLLMRLPAGE